MSRTAVYRLHDSTVAEPLVNRWEAWAHLIPPVPSSLHLREYQIKLLQSYLADPQVHADACANPKLRSGPFVDVAPRRASEVKEFLKRTEEKLAANLKLAQRTIEFQNYLVREAKGLSLDPFYERLPDELRGYVELIYDYYSRPAVRFFEGLLYESPYYRSDVQSFRIFRQQHDNSRSFIMSTPRLPESDQFEWNVPFAEAAVDEFFRLNSKPQSFGYIRELLGSPTASDELLLSLLSEKPPVVSSQTWNGPDARILYFGHACALVEWKGLSILTDPYIGVWPVSGGIDRLTYDDLPERIDYVLITHNHHDHFCLETLLRLRHKIGCLVVPRSSGFFYGDLSLKLLAQKIGFKNIVELDCMQSIALPDGEIVAIPFMGEHADLPHSKSAYVIRTGNRRIMFAADSDCLDEQMYENVRRSLGTIHTVFLGMECVGAPLSWSCGPFFPVKPDHACDQSRRYKGSDSLRGQRILAAVGAERLYIYAMGMEPWFEHLLGLAYDEDAVQLRESTSLLNVAREAGFTHAERLFGKCEITLPATNEDNDMIQETASPVADTEPVEATFVFD
ncbi:MAG TPA: MBL fold metallo-hydrolase [Pyrinomonadaceae bacterium]|nr:MBL fold metallo-hydrolase [Pyrinomonadaceae bacterium]